MKKLLLTLIMMSLPLIAQALEISTSSTNVGIGTTSTLNQLGVVSGLAVGSTAVNSTSPAGGIITDGNLGIGTILPRSALDLNGTLTFANGENISNAVDGALNLDITKTATNHEDMTFSVGATANRILISSTTGVDSFQFVPTKLLLQSTLLQDGLGTPTPNLGIQTTTNNRESRLYIMPKGTVTGLATDTLRGGMKVFNTDFGADTTNYADASYYITDQYIHLNSKCNGTGTCLPTVFSYLDGPTNSGDNTIMMIDNSKIGGNVGIGTTAVATNKFVVSGNAVIGSTYVNSANSAPSNGLLVQGNVGVGSVNPGQSIDVQGTVRATSFAGDGSGITGVLSGLTTNFLTKATGSGTIGNSQILDNGTNVGIGSVTPGQTLDVQGTLRAVGAVVGSGTGFTIGSTGNLTSIGGSTSATLTSSTFALSGNPAVVKNVSATAASSNVFIGGASSTSLAEIRGTSGTGSGDYVKITGGTNGGTEIARFLGSGNVGVGSTTPGQKLDVQGTVRFTTGLLNTASTTGIGWSEHNAGNQACNTTCGTSACVIGLDAGTVGVLNSNFVACSDATADDCVCAGP